MFQHHSFGSEFGGLGGDVALPVEVCEDVGIGLLLVL